MNYEINIDESAKRIVVTKNHHHFVSAKEYIYKSYGFGHMTNHFNDGPKAFVIELQDGGECLFNLENVSSIIYK